MFTSKDLDDLFTAVPQYSGCACSEMFEIETRPRKIIFRAGPEFTGKKVGSNILSTLQDYLFMQDLSGMDPTVGKDFVEFSYSRG